MYDVTILNAYRHGTNICLVLRENSSISKSKRPTYTSIIIGQNCRFSLLYYFILNTFANPSFILFYLLFYIIFILFLINYMIYISSKNDLSRCFTRQFWRQVYQESRSFRVFFFRSKYDRKRGLIIRRLCLSPQRDVSVLSI